MPLERKLLNLGFIPSSWCDVPNTFMCIFRILSDQTKHLIFDGNFSVCWVEAPFITQIIYLSIYQQYLARLYPSCCQKIPSTPISDSLISFTCEIVKWFTKRTIRKKQKGDKLKEKHSDFKWGWQSIVEAGASVIQSARPACVSTVASVLNLWERCQ